MGYKIAITGGIGSGKSTVCDIIKEQGYQVFSCDAIYKDLLYEPSYVKQIEAAFPNVVENNCINLKKLSSIVFDNTAALKRLNAIAHPAIMQTLLKQMNATTDKFVFAEVPLLFEGKFEGLFDKIIVVERDRNERISSVIKRSNLTQDEVLDRMQMQFPYDTQAAKAHFAKVNAIIIQNIGDFNQLKENVLAALMLL